MGSAAKFLMQESEIVVPFPSSPQPIASYSAQDHLAIAARISLHFGYTAIDTGIVLDEETKQGERIVSALETEPESTRTFLIRVNNYNVEHGMPDRRRQFITRPDDIHLWQLFLATGRDPLEYIRERSDEIITELKINSTTMIYGLEKGVQRLQSLYRALTESL